ncbi:DUF7220 family protein [Paracoccus yeei]
MKQTRTMSLIEAMANVVGGYVLAVAHVGYSVAACNTSSAH